MPNVTTTQDDAYMCTSYKIGDDQSFITQIEPLTNMNIAHHMFAFGCEKPASTLKAWNCATNVCQGEKTILFAWARNAPTLQLPNDVAFKVGSETKHRYIVVNIHYLNKIKDDQSGLAIQFSDKPRAYIGGIMIMVTGEISIPPLAKKYHTDISCKYEGRPINVFAYRVHAHYHGDVNTAYRVRNHEWKQLAKGDPQLPQAFYPTSNHMEIKTGDILLGRCVYHNDEEKTIYAGPTHNDEMCNIYLMYYTDSEDNIQDTCADNTYVSLENEIPEESFIKPSAPVNINTNTNPIQHHDMDGSKLHNKNEKQQKQQQQDRPFDFKFPFLSIYNNNGLSKQKKPSKQKFDQAANDEYYDNVERGRSKDRLNSDNFDYNNNNNNNNNQDYSSSSLFDSSDDFVDYPGLDQASTSSLFAALNAQKALQKKKNSNTRLSISKYTLIKNWFDTNKIKLGQVGGVVVDSVRGNIIIFHRGSQTWEYDSFNNDHQFNTRKYSLVKEDTIVVINAANGQFVKSWGANMFYLPHGVKVDSQGFIWVTDVGRHQVFKFSFDDPREPLLVVGQKNEPGSDNRHFCQPADVVVLKNGDFFVADGYCNSRVVKFDKNGKYITEWGSEEEGLPGHFNVPHALALHEPSSLICVADRENYRVQCFDLNGNYMHQSVDKEYGPIYGLSFAANNGSILYAINGFAGNKEVQYEKKILLIQVSDGSIVGTINLDQNEVASPHSIAVNSDASEIYIGTLMPKNVVKYSYLSFTINTENRKKNSTNDVIIKDNIDGDKENFRTSMFIMGFLAIPLIIVVIAAIVIRLKNSGSLRNIGNKIKDSQPSDLTNWIKSTKNSQIRNGFTRLNQDSDNENEPLDNNSDSDSDEITVPISKA